MKWHWLRYKDVLEQIRLYYEKGTDNESDYLLKYHPPIRHRQVRPWFIHTSNLVRKIPQTIILCKGVLNQFPGTHSCIEYLKVIQSKQQSMTE